MTCAKDCLHCMCWGILSLFSHLKDYGGFTPCSHAIWPVIFCRAIDKYLYFKWFWQLCFFICCLNNIFWSKVRTLVIMCRVVLCYIIQHLNSGRCCNCVLIGIQQFCLLSLVPLHNNLMFWLREHWPHFLCLLTFLTCHCTPSLLVILDHFWIGYQLYTVDF